jgi:single-strand DNA-binding protein
MNKVALIGRLTRDPEIRHNQDKLVGHFTLAVDRRYKKDGSEQTADFITCVAFGKTAEFLEKYVHKGTKLVVCGRIQTGSYTNKDGNKVYTTDVVAEECEFAESKATASQQQQKPQEDENGFMNVPEGTDDEFPFK